MSRANQVVIAVLVAILLVYFLLLDTIAKPIFESQATETYGAEVTIDSLEIAPFAGRVTLFNLRVADRGNPMRNLAEADRVYADLSILKLAEDIVEVDDLEIDGLTMLVPRQSPATVLRPLLPDDSAIGMAGLPSFDIPDANALLEEHRGKLENEVAEYRATFQAAEEKWQSRIDSLPDEDDVKAYRERIKALKNAKGLERLSALNEVQKIYAEVNRDLETVRDMRQEFRGDLEMMRETVAEATRLPQKHTEEIIASLGLSSDQFAQIGNRLLQGDFSGLLQEVLAPLAYNESGEVNAANSMPIFIRQASINGPILASAAGFAADGKLENFAWPLELAELPAVLKMQGTSLDGGAMLIDAVVDHRGVPNDRFAVDIDNLSLRDMLLEGTDQLNVKLVQTLANIAGEMTVNGDSLSGRFTQDFSQTLFDIALGDNAGEAAQLVARMLENTNDFMMQIGVDGTLQSPKLSFKADIGDLIRETLEQAISDKVSALTADLQNQVSDQIGPQINAAREQFTSLEALQSQLENSLQGLSGLK